MSDFRALTPEEEEARLGFPRGYTKTKRGTDQERYKSIGNSWAVPVISWLGVRMALIGGLT